MYVTDVAQILHCCGCVYSPAAVAPIRPLGWELPYATGVALKKKKRNLAERCSYFSLSLPGRYYQPQPKMPDCLRTAHRWWLKHLKPGKKFPCNLRAFLKGRIRNKQRRNAVFVIPCILPGKTQLQIHSFSFFKSGRRTLFCQGCRHGVDRNKVRSCHAKNNSAGESRHEA